MEQNVPHKDGANSKTQVMRLTEIGIALSAELNLDALLEKIVHHARELTDADAGTLYLLAGDCLHFKILQNASLDIFQGGTTGRQIDLKPVPLDRANVSAYAALEQKTVNIEDVYESEEFDFSGPRRYDSVTGYRSKSMLVVPMKNHEGNIIGVLQLMNSVDPQTGEVIRFHDEVVGLTEALASQAAVAITNASLIEETKALFESLIRVMATAIDAKSLYTGNHIERVALLNLFLARAINEKTEGPLAGVQFSEKELEEIRLAGWLHDVGKITTPEWVMDKATKLQAIYDRIGLIRMRYAFIKESVKACSPRSDQCGKVQETSTTGDEELPARLDELDQEIQFLEQCNKPSEFLDDEKLARLGQIAQKTFEFESETHARLTENELYNLSIRKGSLTSEEIQVMKDHVVETRKMLSQIPFKGHLKNVPLYAAQHHEKLNGTGYPDGLHEQDIPIQSRILAVADFYEALVAKDRPYKKPMPLEVAFSILRKAAQNGEIDSDILDILIEDKVYERLEKGKEG